MPSNDTTDRSCSDICIFASEGDPVLVHEMCDDDLCECPCHEHGARCRKG